GAARCPQGHDGHGWKREPATCRASCDGLRLDGCGQLAAGDQVSFAGAADLGRERHLLTKNLHAEC
ncbi:unnamed protein product, partial [Urochloa humidicola]